MIEIGAAADVRVTFADQDMLLCDERGVVAGPWLERHNRMATAAGFEPTNDPFPCTGGACYVFGQSIRCTNPIHREPIAGLR